VDDLLERVSRVIAEQFRVAPERIFATAALDEDLGATSVDRVEMIMALEDEFLIEISDDQALQLNNVRDVVACVQAGVKRRAGPCVSAAGNSSA
jgi:acyl carrier protein